MQIRQQDIAKYCKPFGKKELRQGNRKLCEFLQQGDFQSGFGKIGFYYQEKNFLSEVEFDYGAPEKVGSNPDQILKKRNRADIEQTHTWITSPPWLGAGMKEPALNPECNAEPSGDDGSFIDFYFNKRKSKLLEK